MFEQKKKTMDLEILEKAGGSLCLDRAMPVWINAPETCVHPYPFAGMS